MADEDIEHTGERSGLQPRLVLLAFVAVAFGAFVVQNTDGQPVHWLVFDFTLPLWALLVSSAVVGVVVRDLLAWIRRRRD